jgi:hypothetical protein
MNNKMRNLTLSAAALAALVSIAPKADAQERGRDRGGDRGHESRGMERRPSPGFERRESGRQERRENTWRGPGRAYVSPVRPFVRRGYGYAAPFRNFSGFRFYSAYPGPNYVYIANYGWILPPFFGAVWVPAHYDFEGFYVEGGWR